MFWRGMRGGGRATRCCCASLVTRALGRVHTDTAAGMPTLPYFFAKIVADIPRALWSALVFNVALLLLFPNSASFGELYMIVLVRAAPPTSSRAPPTTPPLTRWHASCAHCRCPTSRHSRAGISSPCWCRAASRRSWASWWRLFGPLRLAALTRRCLPSGVRRRRAGAALLRCCALVAVVLAADEYGGV